MKRLPILLFALLLSSCSSCFDAAAPNVSSAVTNRQLVELGKAQNALLDSLNTKLDTLIVLEKVRR